MGYRSATTLAHKVVHRRCAKHALRLEFRPDAIAQALKSAAAAIYRTREMAFVIKGLSLTKVACAQSCPQ